MARRRRTLKAHQKLLLDVIKRQAGTLHKAILEGIMNAIEAKATAVYINLHDQVLEILDDGIGIRSEEEIIHFFETFGTPHEDVEEKIWAQFRMGRGQIFSFGRNTWRTNGFEMFVDVENPDYFDPEHGLQYDFEDNLEHIEGCRIAVRLYKDPCRAYASLQAIADEVKRQVEFMETPIYFNGEQINTPASECKWDDEDDDAYYLWGVGHDLTVYNLGAYVKDISATTAGTIGVIVSKRQLKVNFARNDIQSDCEVWDRINNVVRANRIKKTRQTRRRLNDAERIAALRDIRDSIQKWYTIDKIGLIYTTSGRVVTLDFLRKNRQPWTFAEQGDNVADKLMQANVALCLDEKTYKQLGYKGPPGNFFRWLADSEFSKMAKLYKPFNGIEGEGGLADDFDRTTTTLSHKDLTAVERRILSVLERWACWGDRVIRMGLADSTAAWTDGHSHITLERNWVRKLYLSDYNDCAILVGTIIHELAHDINTTESHVHGEEFYRGFHNICLPDDDGFTPMRYVGYFHAAMRQSRIEERKAAEIGKQRKEKEKRDRKLRIGAGKAVKQAARVRAPAPVRAPAKKRIRGRKKVRRGT